MTTSEQFHIEEVLASYWRVTFDNGPVNLLDPDTVDQLGALIARVENDPDLTVIVFRSDKPGYFMAHWDFLSDSGRVARMAPGPTGLNPYLDNFVRLSRLPVTTNSEIRGRARGAGSEFVLATDIRFASETAVLGQFEVGTGAVPGGGPMARLGRLVGRGRALEILLGGDDIPAALAAQYGYVNRVIPDAEIEGFTDAFARRIAAFDKVAVAGIKKLVDTATLPKDDEFGPGLQAYFATAGRPENQPFARLLLNNGLQQPDGIETNLGTVIGKLRQNRLRKEILMSTSSTRLPTPEGLGSVAGAPNLPVGFTDTFTSRYVDTGALRLHAVIGGDGPPLLLVHGWPQTWYAWRMVMPTLAKDFQVVAVDQRGVGLSDKPRDGYDTGAQARDMVGLMDALGHQRFAMYGTDTGMPIAYALAADYPDRLDRLVVSEAPLPGISPSPPLFVPPLLNARLWHLMFNQLPAAVNEALVRGREDVFFGAEFDASAGTKKLPDDAVRYYIDILASDAVALRGSFEFYRALGTTIAQNEQRKTRRLTLPVLAMGGAESGGEGIGKAMKLAADDVQTTVLPGAGHWVAEQAPKEMLAALTAFLDPYRIGAATAHS
jgi:enoyl-CoA hydratase/carnithine racemase/pimeloyl-ACP methyl ester carboxylesterase